MCSFFFQHLKIFHCLLASLFLTWNFPISSFSIPFLISVLNFTWEIWWDYEFNSCCNSVNHTIIFCVWFLARSSLCLHGIKDSFRAVMEALWISDRDLGWESTDLNLSFFSLLALKCSQKNSSHNTVLIVVIVIICEVHQPLELPRHLLYLFI